MGSEQIFPGQLKGSPSTVPWIRIIISFGSGSSPVSKRVGTLVKMLGVWIGLQSTSETHTWGGGRVTSTLRCPSNERKKCKYIPWQPVESATFWQGFVAFHSA